MARTRIATRSPRWYGWTPALPDHRDLMFRAPLSRLGALPTRIDLRPDCPPIYNQGGLGSCTANAIGAALQLSERKQVAPAVFTPSRLFIYYNERVVEHTVREDTGAMIRDGIKSVSKKGVGPEDDWTDGIAVFTHKPSARAYKDSLKTRAISYYRIVKSLTQLKGCLSSGF